MGRAASVVSSTKRRWLERGFPFERSGPPMRSPLATSLFLGAESLSARECTNAGPTGSPTLALSTYTLSFFFGYRFNKFLFLFLEHRKVKWKCEFESYLVYSLAALEIGNVSLCHLSLCMRHLHRYNGVKRSLWSLSIITFIRLKFKRAADIRFYRTKGQYT